MPLFNRKSTLQRLLDTVGDSLDVPNEIKPNLPSSGKALKLGLIATAGVAGLTAASAGISSLRRRVEGGEDGS